MKFAATTRTLLLVTSLFSATTLAQEAQTAPAPATEEAAAPAPTPEVAQEATQEAAAPATADAPAATPQSEKVTAAVGSPSPGKAMVVFFRPSKFVGAAVGFKVRENDTELGKLRNGNYFAIEVEPGLHSFTVHSESKDVTTIEAEAGETYFLSGSISMGVMVGRPNLSPSNAGAFEAALPKLKKSKPLD